MGSKAGIEKMRGRLIEQYGSVERYNEIQREKASKGGKSGASGFSTSTKEQQAERGKKGALKRWAEVERQRRIGGKE